MANKNKYEEQDREPNGNWLPTHGARSLATIEETFRRGNTKPAQWIKNTNDVYIAWAGGKKNLKPRQLIVLDELQQLFKEQYMLWNYLYGQPILDKQGNIHNAMDLYLRVTTKIDALRKEFAQDITDEEKSYEEYMKDMIDVSET